MKTWILTVKYGYQDLTSYTCYCKENPAKLILTKEYKSLLSDIWDNMWDDFSYCYTENPDEEEEEFEQYENFCDKLNFEAYETDSSEIDDILIDERTE